MLRSGQSSEALNEKLRFVLKKYQGERSKNELYLRPVASIHLYSHINHEIGVNGSIKNIYIFSAIALFVLIIACINFMNLTTARSTDRAREVGLRKVSGAHKTALLNPSGLPSTRGISRDSAVSSFASRMTTTA